MQGACYTDALHLRRLPPSVTVSSAFCTIYQRTQQYCFEVSSWHGATVLIDLSFLVRNGGIAGVGRPIAPRSNLPLPWITYPAAAARSIRLGASGTSPVDLAPNAVLGRRRTLSGITMRRRSIPARCWNSGRSIPIGLPRCCREQRQEATRPQREPGMPQICRARASHQTAHQGPQKLPE